MVETILSIKLLSYVPLCPWHCVLGHAGYITITADSVTTKVSEHIGGGQCPPPTIILAPLFLLHCCEHTKGEGHHNCSCASPLDSAGKLIAG